MCAVARVRSAATPARRITLSGGLRYAAVLATASVFTSAQATAGLVAFPSEKSSVITMDVDAAGPAKSARETPTSPDMSSPSWEQSLGTDPLINSTLPVQ